MIKVKRPAIIPSVLTSRGTNETVNNNNLYLKSENDYNTGKTTFKIKGSIYNASSVKSALRKAQFKKCCFCEKLQNDEYGAVEHFRPKGGFKINRGDKLSKPGYYWTGYLWENLLFVCEPCNKKKGNIFPLEIESDRAKNHKGDITNEKPLLLNPAGIDDPRNHINFNRHFINGITTEGRKTVEICKLDREGINEERLKVLLELEDRIFILIENSNQKAVLRAKKYLRKSILPKAPFSAMAKDFIIGSKIAIS